VAETSFHINFILHQKKVVPLTIWLFTTQVCTKNTCIFLPQSIKKKKKKR